MFIGHTICIATYRCITTTAKFPTLVFNLEDLDTTGGRGSRVHNWLAVVIGAGSFVVEVATALAGQAQQWVSEWVYLTLGWGCCSWDFVMASGYKKKLELGPHQKVRIFWLYTWQFRVSTQYLYSNGRTDWRTDGPTDRQTEILYQYRASVCWSAIKLGRDEETEEKRARNCDRIKGKWKVSENGHEN